MQVTYLQSVNIRLDIWDEVFKDGPSTICGRQHQKILLALFLNTLPHITLCESINLNNICGCWESLCIKNLRRTYETLCAVWYLFLLFKKGGKHPLRTEALQFYLN